MQVEASQEDFDAQQLPAALDHAREADELQPWAATPPLQQAFVLERQGDLDAAAAAVSEATREEPTNWRPWFILSRIEEARGNLPEAEAARARAAELNPRSALFAQ
jgi:predicted Zn-dependent protease